MKRCEIKMNIDITKVMQLDSSVCVKPVSDREKVAFREKIQAWEENEKKVAFREEIQAWEENEKEGDKPTFEQGYFSGFEIWKFVIFNAIQQVFPTADRRKLEYIKAVYEIINDAVDLDCDVVIMPEDKKNFIRSCFAKADKWETAPAIIELVCIVGKTIDQATDLVDIVQS